MTTITTRAGKGSALTYEEMDNNLSNLNNDKLEKSGGTMSGNITFSDVGEGIVFSDNTSITSAAGISGTTYSVSAETATGGANVRLTGSDASTDDVKLAEGTGITVTRTDANVITVATTALLNVVEDLTPQLGGNLDAMNYTISNVDVVSTDGVQLDTTANEAGAVGKLVWDDGEGGINYIAKGGNLDVTIGETNFALVHNGEATTLTKGTVVYAFGAQGNRISVKRAQANVDVTSARTLGLVAESITSGAEGFVITSGTLKGVVTTGLTEGGVIYLSATTAGAFTQTKPYAPDHLVYCGVVTTAGSNGRIDVKIQNGYELEEIHDVNINHNVAIADDHYLIYNSSNDLWENGPLDISDDATPTLGGNLDTGSFTISSTTGALQLADGQVTVGTGAATATISSAGVYDLVLNTNSGTTTSTITITAGANGDITFDPDGTGNVSIATSANIKLGNNYFINTSSGQSGKLFRYLQEPYGLPTTTYAANMTGTTGAIIANATAGGNSTAGAVGSTFNSNVAYYSRGSDTTTRSIDFARTAVAATPVTTGNIGGVTRMGDQDRFRALTGYMDVPLNGVTWGTTTGTTASYRATLVGVFGQAQALQNGTVSSLNGMNGIVTVSPSNGSITARYATGQMTQVGFITALTGTTGGTIDYARGLSFQTFGTGTVSGQTYTITNAIGLHIVDGSMTGTNNWALLNEQATAKIETNGNLDVTGTTTVGTLNTGNVTTTGNLSVSAVMTVGNYASGSLPSGAVGSIIAINNNGGRLAYWDTTNSRWSYVFDNSAV